MSSKFFRSKKINMIISLLLAVIMWAYVITEENPTVTQKFENVPVSILNAETLTARELAVLPDENLSVNVTVEGKRFDLNQLTPEDIIVTVDVYGYSYGENRIPVTVDVPDAVSVVDVKSNRVTINIDKLVSEPFQVSIDPDKTSETKELLASEVIPAEVMVTGPRTIVDKVKKVEGIIATGNLTEKASEESVPLVAVDETGTLVKGVSLSAQTVDVAAQMLPTKEVSLKVETVGSVSGKYSISRIDYPEKVKIKGTSDALDSVESVKARAVDISEVTATTKLPVNVVLPEGIYICDESKDVSVYIVIDNVAVKDLEFDTSSISMLGLGEGYTAHVDTEDVSISIKGGETQINSATAADVLLQADLTGLGEGTHLVSLTATYSKPFKAVEIIPAQIQVTINAKGE